MSMFKYILTDSQYSRFQHSNNNGQIQELGHKVGVIITDEFIEGGVEKMRFKGRCSGTMALVPCDNNRKFIKDSFRPLDHYECWIQVRSKPWYIPWALLDWGFKKALI